MFTRSHFICEYPTQQAIIQAITLNLFSHSCNRNIEHLAVFSHRATCDTVALLVKDIHKVLVGEWMALILIVDTLLKDCLNLVARHLLARGSLHTLRKKGLEQDDTKVGLDVLAIHHTRYCRNV